ncbi:general substrate transporter [Fistulina hepatica ATCC 64428]|uniref:General substrate transporter n=1 Tax=Fistulina hepatica ATCC 64428 TaxID=1128425 RepID=A0A0D7AFN8_9AGAR|nr:general substrate transporter [Fistulina hepatica ATCC 64428]
MWTLPVRGRWMIWAITACCCQGFLLLGYDQGVMSGLIGADNQFGKDFGHPDSTAQGTIVAIYDIGCAIGSLIVFFWGERIGRKRMIMAGASVMIIGTALLTSSTTRTQLYVGRVVTGIGNGFNSSSIPVFQSETCGGHIRGRLVCLNSTITIIGLVFAYWLDYGMSFVDGPVQWRLPIGFQAVFAICLLVQASMLPGDPRWLLAHGFKDEAISVIGILEDKPEDHPHVIRVKDEIQLSLDQESAGGPFSYKELLEGGPIGNFRRICLCIGISAMQQFTGCASVHYSYLAPIVYENTMGLSRNLALILAGATETTFMLASFIPLWTVDRFGRRPLLMISATGLSLCFVLVAILLSIGSKSAAYGATAMVFIYQIFFGMGFLPVPWLYPAEISTTRIRSKGSAIFSFINWMCVFAVVEMTPPAIANIGWRVFIIFAIFNALWVPIIFVFFPETKGLELEDLDRVFEKGGITGGVWSTRGQPIRRARTLADLEVHADASNKKEAIEVRDDELAAKSD